MTNQRRDIGRHFDLLQFFEKLAHLQHRAAAVSENQRGDAHANEIFSARLLVDFLGMRVDINETRRNHQTARFNFFFAVSRDFPDGGDASVFDAEVREESRIPGAIRDAAIAQN